MGAISAKPYSNGAFPTMIWGSVVKEPKSSMTKKGEPKVSVSVLVHSSGKDSNADSGRNFVNVAFYGDNFFTRTAATLENGDVVVVGGDFTTTHYTNKDGEPKVWTELVVNGKTGILICMEWFKQLSVALANGVPVPNAQAAPPQFTSPAQGVSVQFDDADEGLPF